MFDRFTDRAQKVMDLANQEAQRFNHEYIGTEHILLGLIKEGSGVEANVLKNMGLDLGRIRKEVEELLKTGPDMVIQGKLSQTPRAEQAIEYAIEEATKLNHNYVDTEHILLGLLRVEKGIAVQILVGLGLKLEDVRKEVLNLLVAGADTKEAPKIGQEKENPIKFKIFLIGTWEKTEKDITGFMKKKKFEGIAQSDTLITIAYRDSS